MSRRPVEAPRATALAAFAGLLLRDLRVVTNERGRFLLRTLSQPLLLVFVFTYVFPKIGQGFRAPAGDESFTTVLVPGVIAIAVLIKGIQAVALPLVQEFGYTSEIEDRVMAPLPVWAVAVEKIVAGAVQGLIAALLVFPIAAVVPAEPAALQISWPALVVVGLLAPFAASALGLALGTMVEPNQVPLMFSVVILPITFLGATYYPWARLDAIPWLQAVTLLNPLVYMAEGYRMALTPQIGHMPGVAIYAALVAFPVGMGVLGVRGFRRRVLS
ncbi:MAG: ABC transporter permease [Euzebyaceae bacterium]|jgi:ABC-2 type transport system permease protein|nr:ABC transporter permease [Euzebyaceae bacterium]